MAAKNGLGCQLAVTRSEGKFEIRISNLANAVPSASSHVASKDD